MGSSSIPSVYPSHPPDSVVDRPRRRNHPLEISSVKRQGQEWNHLLQKVFRIRAALSLSLSSEVGQKASDPILFENLLTGAPSLSVLVSIHDQLLFVRGTVPSAFQVLSNPVLLVVLVFSQEGSKEVTLCILVDPSNTACYRLNDGGGKMICDWR